MHEFGRQQQLYAAAAAAAPRIVPNHVDPSDAFVVVVVLVQAGLLDLNCEDDGGRPFVSPQVFQRLAQMETDGGHITSLVLGSGAFGEWRLPDEIRYLQHLQRLTLTGRCIIAMPTTSTTTATITTTTEDVLPPLLPHLTDLVVHFDKMTSVRTAGSWMTNQLELSNLRRLDLRFRRNKDQLHEFLHSLKGAKGSLLALEELSLPGARLTEDGLEVLRINTTRAFVEQLCSISKSHHAQRRSKQYSKHGSYCPTTTERHCGNHGKHWCDAIFLIQSEDLEPFRQPCRVPNLGQRERY